MEEVKGFFDTPLRGRPVEITNEGKRVMGHADDEVRIGLPRKFDSLSDLRFA